MCRACECEPKPAENRVGRCEGDGVQETDMQMVDAWRASGQD